MKLLFIADGRSPTALNWIRYFVDTGHEVHLASTYPCAPGLNLASLSVIPAAGGELAGESPSSVIGRRSVLRRIVPVWARTWVRQLIGPLTLPRAARRLRALVDDLQPDLIHAMRIPYEGMLAAVGVGVGASRPYLSTNRSEKGGSPLRPPLIVSVWGNDFTLHAPANPWLGRLTRQTLARADALHTDCQRDQRLAREWGFSAEKPAIVLPGGGGIQLDVFYPPLSHQDKGKGKGDRGCGGIIINPRGVRAYVRNDTFFQAIPLVLARLPETKFVCPTMAGEALAERWVSDLGIAGAVELLPRQTRPQMADLFRRAQVVVSPATHDGTPNTLLEAMACGCYPVAGDIESLREWITPGVNGALAVPGDPAAFADAILRALENPALREAAAGHNVKLIAEKAEYGAVMRQAEGFYSLITDH